MATRDLTPLYLECRKRKTAFGILEGTKDSKLDSNNRLLGDDGQGNWRATLPPQWVDVVDQCEEHLAQLDKQMDLLSTLHTKRLMVTFDDSNEADQERKIETQSNSITQILRKAEKEMKQVVVGELENSDAKVRKNIQISLAKKLQEKGSRFRALQKEYMSKLQNQRSGASGGHELEFLSAPKSRNTTSSITVGYTQQQLQVVDDLEQVAAERDQEIERIATSIEELSAIFKELAVLVIDQGTILDRIDFNMEQVVEHTKVGLEQLNKAEKHQKSARPIKCIMILLCLIAIMMTMLIVKHSNKGGGGGGRRYLLA